MSNYTFQEDWHSPAGHDIKHYTGRWTPAGRDVSCSKLENGKASLTPLGARKTVAYVVFCQ